MRMYYFHNIVFRCTEKNANSTYKCLSREEIASKFIMMGNLFCITYCVYLFMFFLLSKNIAKMFPHLARNADLQIAHLPQNASHWSKTTMARNSTWAGNSQRSIGLRNGTSLITTGFFKCYIQSDTKIVSYDNKLISVFLM